jgi:ribosomal protein L11 methyltransferase
VTNWLEIAVSADEEAVEAVAEVLRAHGRGVAIDQPFIQPRIDEPPEPDPSRRPIVKTYVPQDAAAEDARSRIEQALWHLSQLRTIEPPEVRVIAEEDWANAWKDFFPVLHLARRTVIVPAWRRYRPREGEVTLRLDPGMAFGTGMHPTTRLCLTAIEDLVHPGVRVLDVGTGSGILSIAATRHGAAAVVGLDVDPIAVAAARSNVKLNHLSRIVRILEADPVAGASQLGQFDIVLANITARTNASLAAFHTSSLRSSGQLVASGILEDTADMVIAAFRHAGLKTLRTEQDGDWVAITAAHA